MHTFPPASQQAADDRLETSLDALFASLEADRRADLDARPRGLAPSADLCVLALLAESDELTADPGEGDELSPDSRSRLASLLDDRPPHYFSDLMRCARTLGLLHRDGDHFRVTNTEAELLGATCSECFPAFLATWLKDSAWLDDVLGAHELEQTPGCLLQLELVRALGVFEPLRWYRLETLSRLNEVVLADNDVTLEPERLQELTDALLERALLVLGTVELSEDGEAFRLKAGLTLPPLPSHLGERAARERTGARAREFRDVVRERLRRSAAWTRVTAELEKVEHRRARQCHGHALKMIDDVLIETCPTTPFRDCLYLARFGQLVDQGPDHRGRYVFKLDVARVGRTLTQEGESPGELLQFVRKRCADEDSLDRVRALIHRSATKP